MITLQFPKLDKALEKAERSWSDDDPRRGIIVFQSKAIVLASKYCLVVDLYDYFTIDCQIDDEDELEELNRILFYMNSKVFNKEFWSELVKGANMKMEKGLLHIETPKYAKELHYKDNNINILEPLAGLVSVSKHPENMVSSIAIPFGALNAIYETLKADFKEDHIVMEFSDQTRPVRFTFKNRRHFYGYIYPDYDAAQEGFRFEDLQYFANDEMVTETIAELKAAAAPRPPEGDTPINDIEPKQSQTDIFGGNITVHYE